MEGDPPREKLNWTEIGIFVYTGLPMNQILFTFILMLIFWLFGSVFTSGILVKMNP
jgi:hypothetical protein